MQLHKWGFEDCAGSKTDRRQRAPDAAPHTPAPLRRHRDFGKETDRGFAPPFPPIQSGTVCQPAQRPPQARKHAVSFQKPLSLSAGDVLSDNHVEGVNKYRHGTCGPILKLPTLHRRHLQEHRFSDARHPVFGFYFRFPVLQNSNSAPDRICRISKSGPARPDFRLPISRWARMTHGHHHPTDASFHNCSPEPIGLGITDHPLRPLCHSPATRAANRSESAAGSPGLPDWR